MPPTFLIDSLNGVRRKVKVLSVAFGVGVVLACAVGRPDPPTSGRMPGSATASTSMSRSSRQGLSRKMPLRLRFGSLEAESRA